VATDTPAGNIRIGALHSKDDTEVMPIHANGVYA
jgi:hypothetical protein